MKMKGKLLRECFLLKSDLWNYTDLIGFFYVISQKTIKFVKILPILILKNITLCL